MRTSSLATILTGASLALAVNAQVTNYADLGLPEIKTEYPSGAWDCQTSQAALSSGRPTVPPAIKSWSATALEFSTPTVITKIGIDATEVDDYCSSTWFPRQTATPPASLSEEFSSYKAAWSSWRESVSPAAHAVASKCMAVHDQNGLVGAGYAFLALNMIATDAADCVTAYSLGNVEAATGTNAQTGAKATSSSSTGLAVAGPRETGYMAAAVALAGIAGAVAAI
ncbi:hypothetical protein QBC35DRAFT_299358 [Podospora australis]|uniref:Infection structure specific protein n=1 Tax=Podospora australis TaxID=1536484 RepID=A0AAN6WPZ3_9PEZI|nr:hypothetical protein QBC35DRAFT_299358 [Podospora australis]